MKNMQCLWYALDKWKSEGGYLLLGRSTYWCIPHVLHMNRDKKVMHYVPFEDLKYPWYSIFGFDGEIVIEDNADRKPMNSICMFLGTLILLVFGGLWFFNRKFRK